MDLFLIKKFIKKRFISLVNTGPTEIFQKLLKRASNQKKLKEKKKKQKCKRKRKRKHAGKSASNPKSH